MEEHRDYAEEAANQLLLDRPCGCPGDASDPHVADCDGNRAPTKQDYLERYSDSYPDDWPDSEGEW